MPNAIARELWSIAREVGEVVQVWGMGPIRELVLEGWRIHAGVVADVEQRDQARREIYVREGALTERPSPGDGCVIEARHFHGRVVLPAGVENPDTVLLFELAKAQGFPENEADSNAPGVPYHFDVYAWLPPNLSCNEDKDLGGPLPIPMERIPLLSEKAVALAAIHDEYLPKDEPINPWKAKEDIGWVEWLETSPEGVWFQEQRATAGYLTQEALPVLRLWLDHVKAKLQGERLRPAPAGEQQRPRASPATPPPTEASQPGGADKPETPTAGGAGQRVEEAADRGETGAAVEGLRSFIVHGHDETAKLALKNYLQNTLKWPEPVILAEKPSGGKTIIEKFEERCKNIDVVFVLLTPDDMGGAVGSPSAARARQNVILELGHFTGKFGRTSGRVILLHKGGLELPSDLAGIVHIDISNGVEAAGENIRREVATLARIE